MTLNYRLDGPENGVPLVLGPSLGCSLHVWDGVVDELTRAHRVLRFDLPGHGESPTVPGATTIDALAALVLEAADRAGFDSFHYAGVSIGGAIGASLALTRPERVVSLAMVCSSARFGEPAAWRERAANVRANGTAVMVEATASRWFAGEPGPLGARLLADLAAADDEGYAACCEALAAYDVRAELPRLTLPVLIVGGKADPATPSPHARELADAIPSATLLELPAAAHLAPVDRPAPLASALLTHLTPASSAHPAPAQLTPIAPASSAPLADPSPQADASASPQGTVAASSPQVRSGVSSRKAASPSPGGVGNELYSVGMGVRREVLGDAHVDRANARMTEFTREFQGFITRYAWGEIWTRPGLDRRTRSAITLTALIARGHEEELAMHVRAAVTNGLSADEIKEVLLQSAVYCGVPAANSAFAVAQRVLDALSAEETS
ncbi:4-carboxymuconolactone decarboxylase [Actinocorallia sp. A-T 12471]|uniref:bifunctional 3-oxoadipate enol-lactonase/4-carboxymuconolactone decarboxylase PcaDC n=1 Tax=Actinocorallia sp. A-T 12471 TaxID=3089813 RepID=UPI0029D2694D|nr:4-carboxymuconolactone decarboxylase [Actinocorallia sp. A-T 12471]MDX6740393.1 4-carboxymuconolactone decarboxylase [Actinocorallia sp. A-T 12471]